MNSSTSLMLLTYRRAMEFFSDFLYGGHPNGAQKRFVQPRFISMVREARFFL